jgi:hypothetical protein
VDVLVDLHDGVLGERVFAPDVFPFVDDRLRRLVAMYKA